MSNWPQPYSDLADAMGELRSRFPTPTLLAASVVHPRHSIPQEHLELLSDIAAGRPARVPGFLSITAKFFVAAIAALYDTFFLFILNYRFGEQIQRRTSVSCDILLKTWVPGPEALAKPADFYYGSMYDVIKSANAKPLFLAGDGRSDDGRLPSKLKSGPKMWEFLLAAEAKTNTRYFPEILLVPVLAPLAGIFSQLLLSFKLKAFASRQPENILKHVAARAVTDVLRPYTTKNLWLYHAGLKAVRAWKPKAVVTFFEGQPWEKLFWLGARKADPSVRIVGYQHTVVMPHAFALLKPFKSAWEVSAPNLVLCTGEKTKELVEAGVAPFGARCRVIGSHRRAPSATTSQPPRPEQRTVLVLPEGILSEAIILFDFAMAAAASSPDRHFIFRCHPVLPYEKIEPHMKRKRTEFSNIELSTGPSIQDDFHRASALLYRGSSAAMYAVLDGVRPFCLLVDGTPNVDPLFALSTWRTYISNVEEFSAGLKSFSATDASAREREWRAAASDVERLTEPVNDASVQAFVQEVL